MFCTKCGSQLEDGAKFCTNCGAQTRFAQVPTPAAQPEPPAAPAPAEAPAPVEAAASAAPVTPAPAQPVQPQQPQWQQPQQWQQPAQPQQPQWQPQQQQQPQWQQIQQQWQQQQRQAVQQQQARQQWQQQQQPQWQPQQQPARGGSHTQPKKKGKGGLIAGIIAAVLVVAVGVGGFVWPGYLKGGKGGAAGIGGKSGGAISTALAEKFSTPEEFYQTVETNNVESLAGHVSTAYDSIFLSNASSDDLSVAGALRIELGDKARELVLDALGEQLEEINPGEDLKWLKSIALTYDVSKKDVLNGINAAVQLNGSDIAHIKAVLQSEDGKIWLSVPELTDKYLATTLEELNLDDLPISGGGGLGSILGKLSPEDSEKLDPIIDALPDDKTVSTVISKYLSEAVDCIEDVQKESGKLETEGVSADYTVLTSTITPETMVKIIEKIGPELKEDKDIKKAILDVAAAAGEEGEPKYKEFTDKIDELLNDTDSIRENMKSNIVMTVYLDKSGDVHGRVIDSGDQKIELLMPESGGQFGLTIRYTDESGEKLLLNGSGKRSGDKLTGDLDLTIEGEYYAVLALDGFDAEKVKDGYLVGGVELRPTASLWSKLLEKAGKDDEDALPESVKSLLESLVLRFDLNTSKDKAAVTLTLTNGSDKFISIAIDGTKGAAKKISTVEGVETEEWVGDITLDKLEKVVGSIEKAGVPTAYTDKLDEALDNAFD